MNCICSAALILTIFSFLHFPYFLSVIITHAAILLHSLTFPVTQPCNNDIHNMRACAHSANDENTLLYTLSVLVSYSLHF